MYIQLEAKSFLKIILDAKMEKNVKVGDRFRVDQWERVVQDKLSKNRFGCEDGKNAETRRLLVCIPQLKQCF